MASSIAMNEARSSILEALQCSCSQDPSVLNVGERQLKAWENEKGFYATLAVRLSDVQITANYNVPYTL